MPDVQQFIEDSLNRFDTLTAAVVEWHDVELTHRAWTSRGADASTFIVARAIAGPELRGGAPANAGSSMRRVWWRKPDCLRDDVFLGEDLLGVNVCRGAIAGSYAAGLRLMCTNDPSVRGRRPWPLARVPKFGLPTVGAELTQIPLFRPPFRHPDWAIDVMDREQTFAGRAAFTIAAHRSRPDVDGSEFRWSGFDQFSAIVDAERGLPLRMAALVDGREAITYVVQSIRFDEPIPDDVFHFEPPAGTAVVRVAPELEQPTRTTERRWWQR